MQCSERVCRGFLLPQAHTLTQLSQWRCSGMSVATLPEAEVSPLRRNPPGSA
jgi:hypothetical protein